MNSRERSFTLMELMIVVVIIGIIAGFAIPTYSKALIKTHERDMIIRAQVLYAAGKIYYAKNNQYPSEDLDTFGIANTFRISLTDTDKLHFDYHFGHIFVVHYETADWWGFHVCANLEEPLSNINPCCHPGEPCPTLVSCTYACY